MFTRADLKLDLDTHLVAGMRADWIRRTTIGGQIPIFVLIKSECDSAIRTAESVQHHQCKIVRVNMCSASEIEVRGKPATGTEHYLPEHAAAFEREVFGQAGLMKELQQMSQNDVDLNVSDVARARAGCGLTKLADGQHYNTGSRRSCGTSARSFCFVAFTKMPQSAT